MRKCVKREIIRVLLLLVCFFPQGCMKREIAEQLPACEARSVFCSLSLYYQLFFIAELQRISFVFIISPPWPFKQAHMSLMTMVSMLFIII